MNEDELEDVKRLIQVGIEAEMIKYNLAWPGFAKDAAERVIGALESEFILLRRK